MEKLESHILVYDKKSNKSFSYSRHAQNYEHFLLPFPSFSNQSCLFIQLFSFFLLLLFDIKVGPYFDDWNEEFPIVKLIMWTEFPYPPLLLPSGHKYHLKVVESKYLQKGKTSIDHSQNHEQFKLKFMSHTIYPYWHGFG